MAGIELVSIAQSQGLILSCSQCLCLSGFVGSHGRFCEHDYSFGLAQLRLNSSSVSQDRALLGAIWVLCIAVLFGKGVLAQSSVQPP